MMAVTVGQLINQSFRATGMLASGEIPEAAEAQDALLIFNQMIDLWNIESLMIYTIERLVFPLTSGQQNYTIGPVGANWTAARPTRVEAANFQLLGVTPVLEIPLRILTDQEYESIRIRGVTSTLSTWLYYDQAYPLGTVFLWPVPTSNDNIVLWVEHQLSSDVTLTTSIALPPGYQQMIVYNLAVQLSAQGMGKPASALVAQLAISSKTQVKSNNNQAPLIKSDPAIVGTGRIGYNWRDDNY